MIKDKKKSNELIYMLKAACYLSMDFKRQFEQMEWFNSQKALGSSGGKILKNTITEGLIPATTQYGMGWCSTFIMRKAYHLEK